MSRNRLIREFKITGLAVKMEFKCDFDTVNLQHINKRFEGMVQLDLMTSGDFSDFDVEKLESLIIAYFQNNTKVMIPDIYRK